MSSSVPVGAQQPILPYPGTFYWFDPCLFYGQNTALDLDQAENLDLVENCLYALMKLPSTVDGCTMIMKQRSVKVICHRRRSWTFLCSHGIIVREMQDSYFGPNSVGKVNVSLQSRKKTNSKGASIRGNYILFVIFYFFSIILILTLICHVLETGVDAMANKEIKKRLIFESYKKRNLISSDCAQRKTVSR